MSRAPNHPPEPISAPRLATLEAAARRIVPHAFLGESARGKALVAGVARRIAALSPPKRGDLELAIDLLGSRWAALLTGVGGKPFASLTPELQDRMLAKWLGSPLGPLRTVAQAVRRLVLLIEYATADAQREVGYLGPYHSRPVAMDWEGAVDGFAVTDEPVLRQPRPPIPGTAPAPRRSAWKTPLPNDGDILRAEIVIVGSGAGGSVAAARLAEAGHDVLVLEEGDALAEEDFDEREGELLERLYADGGLRSTDDVSVSMLQGATLGGGTTVNWMIMLRTPDWVLDEWAARHGAAGMSPRDLAPVFDQVEADVHARPVPDDAHSPNNRILIDGCRALGWRVHSANINARNCLRTGFCGYGCRYGAKQGALQVYLPRAVAAGARIVASARADRIELQERGGPFPLKRVHVTVSPPNEPPRTVTVIAPVVIVSAGAVGTPVLLQRSGLGGDAVGRFLRLHPTTAVIGRYDRAIYGAAGIPLSAMSDEFLRTDKNGYGFWLECPPLHPAIAATSAQGFGAAHRALMKDFRSLGSLITLVRDGAQLDHSSGDVRAARDGRIRIRYKLSAPDARHLVAGIVANARLHLAAGAREVQTLHSDPVTVRTESDLAAISSRPTGPNQIALFSAHVNGTCRIGNIRAASGTDPHGERHGAPGVFVIDGSLLPTALGVNPQETIMALATVLAGRIAARRRAG